MIDYPLALHMQDTQDFDLVDEVVTRSFAVGDPLIALEYARTLQRDSLLKGLAIAKLMYKIKQGWALFERAGIGDTFENVVDSMNGYKSSTIDKYIRMWESIFENDTISPDIKEKIAGRPVKDLLLLTAAAREGSFSQDQWERVATAADTNEVKEVIRAARGEQTSAKTAISIILTTKEDSSSPVGTLSAFSNGQREVIGVLHVNNSSELAQKAIARIINAARVIEA